MQNYKNYKPYSPFTTLEEDRRYHPHGYLIGSSSMELPPAPRGPPPLPSFVWTAPMNCHHISQQTHYLPMYGVLTTVQGLYPYAPYTGASTSANPNSSIQPTASSSSAERTVGCTDLFSNLEQRLQTLDKPNEHSANGSFRPPHAKQNIIEHRGRPKASHTAATASAALHPPANFSLLTAESLEPDREPITGDCVFRCRFSECGNTFKTRFSMKRHLKMHTGNKCFICPHEGCNKQFAEKSTLKRHLRVHTGEKPYRCAIRGCDKYFADRSAARRHEMMHSVMHPYQCPHSNCTCGYFGHRQLQKHIEAVHEALDLASNGKEGDTIVSNILNEMRTVTDDCTLLEDFTVEAKVEEDYDKSAAEG